MVFCLQMWDLVPQPGIKPRPLALEVQSLSHLTTTESLNDEFYFPWTHLKVDSRIEAPTLDSTNPSRCYWSILIMAREQVCSQTFLLPKDLYANHKLLSTSWGQRFSVTGNQSFLASLSETSNLSPHTDCWQPQFGAPWYRHIQSYLGSENKEPSTPERKVPDRVRYFGCQGH